MTDIAGFTGLEVKHSNGEWTATHPDIPGLRATGGTEKEAIDCFLHVAEEIFKGNFSFECSVFEATLETV